MPRKRKPRVPTAGEVVSFFEEMPVEFAVIILDIVTMRIDNRRAIRDKALTTHGDLGSTGQPKGRTPKADAEILTVSGVR